MDVSNLRKVHFFLFTIFIEIMQPSFASRLRGEILDKEEFRMETLYAFEGSFQKYQE